MRKPALQTLLDAFVLWDRRLGSQDDVAAHVRLRQGDRLIAAASVPPAWVGDLEDIGLDTSYGTLVTDRCYSTGPISPYRVHGVRGIALDVGRTMLTVPLLVGGTPIGALSLLARKSYVGAEKLGSAQLLAGLLAYAHVHIDGRAHDRTPASEALGSALLLVRQELGLTQDEVAARVGTTRIAVSRWEGGGQPPSMGPLTKWCTALGVLAEAQRPVIRTANFTPQALMMLREDPNRLRGLTPAQFEEFVADRLDKAGYEVTLTGAVNTPDGGIDIIATLRQPGVCPYMMAVQVKHHEEMRRTGDLDVRAMFSLQELGFSFGMIVTNTEFTKNARWREERSRAKPFLRLRGIHDIVRWLHDDFAGEQEWQELPDKIEIAPGVWVAVPRPRLERSLDIWPLRPGPRR